MYSINFTEKNKKFCLSLHYNGANRYLFVNGKEIIKFIWNPSKCDCECDKTCNIGEYLDYENC